MTAGIVTVYAAPAVVPVTAPAIRDGAVAVAGDRIVAVGPHAEVRRAHPVADVIELEGVITPGLVNAHTHLQFTSFAVVGRDPFPSYVRWAERFVEEHGTRRDEDWRATALDGVAAGLSSGTTCFGDVVTNRQAMDVLVTAGVAGVAYFEIIGTDEARWTAGIEAEVVEVLSSTPTTAVSRVGLAPHAPYSVTPAALRAAAALARRLGVRLHSHVAEVDSEDEFYRTGTGPWADRVRAVVARPWPILDDGGTGRGVVDLAADTGLLGPDCHLAHGVYLDRAGRASLAAAGTAVALCPRSNLTVGSAPPPVADYLRERVPFCVGTDSLGSNRSLDLLEDVALLRRLALDGGYDEPDLDYRLLAAATIDGARALGLDDCVGSLTVGKRADLAEFAVDPVDAVGNVVRAGAGRCQATYTAGHPR